MDNLICLLKILSMYELSRCIKTLVADQRMGEIQRGSLNHIFSARFFKSHILDGILVELVKLVWFLLKK